MNWNSEFGTPIGFTNALEEGLFQWALIQVLLQYTTDFITSPVLAHILFHILDY